MYRKVVLSSIDYIKGPFHVLYHVRGAAVLYQQKEVQGPYNSADGSSNMINAIVFDDSVHLTTTSPANIGKTYEFILDVPYNQPTEEAVEEITSTGVAITVYNEHGVIVCHNGKGIPTSSSPTQTDGRGEMTSEPIDGTGEMTSEPIDGPGEMT